MAKGGISLNDAKKTQSERYRIWLPLLKNELELLGNPKIIFIGKGLYDKQKRYFPDSNVKYVLHHSGQNNNHVKIHFNNIRNEIKHEPPKKDEVERLALDLMKMHKYSKKLQDEILKKQFRKEFTEHDKRLLTVYRYDFETFTKSI